MKTAVILLVAVIVCGSTFAVQYLRLQKAEAMCAALPGHAQTRHRYFGWGALAALSCS